MIKKYTKFLEMKKEHSGADYKYGCVMVHLNVPNWNEIISYIKPEDLYKPEVERYGVETEPHITILYGLHENVNDSDVEKIVKSVDGDDIVIDITGIDIFQNDEFDVVKMTVKSEYLTKLHYELCKLPNSDKYPTYNPHITIAYVNKNMGSKYQKSNYKHHIEGVHSVIYSKPDGSKIRWTI